jgi:hypothetical protein
MAVPQSVDVVKITVSGTIGSSGQTWSTNFWISVGGGTTPTQALLDAYLVNLKPAIQTWITAIGVRWSNTVIYSGLKASYIPAGSLKPTLVSVTTPTGFTGGGAVTLPGFCSLVASLRSSVPTRRGRGRLYIPLNATTVTTDGEAISAAVSSYSSATATMMTSVNAVAVGFSSGSGLVSVVSWTAGQAHPVVKVIVDSKIDVQHRRTDKLGADFTTTTTV